MSNMKFIYNGTFEYTFANNPSTYDMVPVSLEDNQRTPGGDLVYYPKGEYKVFSLSFDFMGTAQEANLGTIFSLHKTIDFYPMDENKGTALYYTVVWPDPYDIKRRENWWSSGFTGNITLEEV